MLHSDKFSIFGIRPKNMLRMQKSKTPTILSYFIPFEKQTIIVTVNNKLYCQPLSGHLSVCRNCRRFSRWNAPCKWQNAYIRNRLFINWLIAELHLIKRIWKVGSKHCPFSNKKNRERKKTEVNSWSEREMHSIVTLIHFHSFALMFPIQLQRRQSRQKTWNKNDNKCNIYE